MSVAETAMIASLLVVAGCKRGHDAKATPLAAPANPEFRSSATLHERSGRGRLSYLGMDVRPKEPSRGETVELRHYFRVDVQVAGDYEVFVHGDEAGSGKRLLVADHPPIGGLVPTSQWAADDIWVDTHSIRIPDEILSNSIDILVGLFDGDMRLTVEAPPGGSDGRDRILAARLDLRAAKGGPEGAPSSARPSADLPEVIVARATGTISADGKLDEPSWSLAPRMVFSDSMGRNVTVSHPTQLRLLYDDANLYVAFEASDPDISDRYRERDDPIYEHEAVEVFIMPMARAPQLGPYIELQASPGGVIFDASFVARRQGMNVAFNAGQTVGTRIDGTLNSPGDVDRGWVSEWTVPWKTLPGIAAHPKPGDEWRLNAFRIEKFRVGGREEGEYTAWSPPRVGDFHNVERFGRMRFGPSSP